MDPFAQMVELLRPRALLWKQMVGEGDWAWSFAPRNGVVIGLVLKGQCRVHLPGHAEKEFGEGDCLLITSPSAWILRSACGNNTPVAFEDIYPGMDAFNAVGASDDGLTGRVRIVGGHFEFDSVNAGLLSEFVPDVMLGSAGQLRNGQQLENALAMINVEAAAQRPGHETVLSRLLEIVLIELLRTPGLLGEAHRGLLAGLGEPRIAAALRAFHGDVGQRWSVASLAAAAGMSRAVFSHRFTSLLGRSPMRYVFEWRMAIAKDALRVERRSVETVAAAVGYSSASAFSTAFTKTVGVPPAKYAGAFDVRRNGKRRLGRDASGN